MKQILLSLGRILAGVVIGVPVLVTASATIPALIEGQSVPEALSTLAGSVELLMGRVDTLERGQIGTATSTVAIEAGLSDLRTANESLERANASLASKLDYLEARPAQVIERTTIVEKSAPVPVTIVEVDIPEELYVSLKNRPQRSDPIGDGAKNVQMFSIHLQASGNVPVAIDGFYVALRGDAPREMINSIELLAGNDALLATDVGGTPGVLEYHVTINPGEGRDFIIAIDMDDDVASFGPRSIGLSLDNILVSNAKVVGFLPVEGMLYTASSTRR